MTTTVDATVRPDVDIAAWLEGEIELPCEATHHGVKCAELHPEDSLATHVAFISWPCGHSDPRAGLLCAHCHTHAKRGRLLDGAPCGMPLHVVYMEPLR